MAPTLTPQQFVEKWRRVTIKERSGYQGHDQQSRGNRQSKHNEAV